MMKAHSYNLPSLVITIRFCNSGKHCVESIANNCFFDINELTRHDKSSQNNTMNS